MKKNIISFIAMGLLYLNMEVFARTIRGELIGFKDLRWESAAGWTSLWMLFIGGFCGLFIGSLNERKQKLPIWVQCLIGTIFVFIVELSFGLIANVWLGLHLWSYADWPLNLWGQVTALYIPVWFMLCPFVIWLDDLLRHILHGQPLPPSVFDYYKWLFNGG
jgi:hypothetical protein